MATETGAFYVYWGSSVQDNKLSFAQLLSLPKPIYKKLAHLPDFARKVEEYWKGTSNIVVENGNYGN